jgi:hypothetical protein
MTTANWTPASPWNIVDPEVIFMKRLQQFTMISAALLTSLPAFARSYPPKQMLPTVHGPGLQYSTAATATLSEEHVIKAFIHRDGDSGKLLYVVYPDREMDVFDVTDNTEPRNIRHETLASDVQESTVNHAQFRLLMLGSKADTAASPLLLVDSSVTARPAIAKAFDSADAYAIDPEKLTIYVIRGSQLSVLQFDGPINQSGERFEESYQSR